MAETQSRAHFLGHGEDLGRTLLGHASQRAFVKYDEEPNLSKAKIDRAKITAHKSMLDSLHSLQSNLAFRRQD
eukprot:4297200-Alexandrium_andersonii.AAC.1